MLLRSTATPSINSSRPAIFSLLRLVFSVLSRGSAPPFEHSNPQPFSTSSRRRPRSSGGQARDLRPAGSPQSLSKDDGDSHSDAEGTKSRNEMKREAHRTVRWGMELATFSAADIKRVLRATSLESEVFDALMLVKKLGSDVWEGRRRQFNYIGRLLREAQPELMDALIQASKDGDSSRFAGLICDDESWHADYDEEDEDSITYEVNEGNTHHVEVAVQWFDGLVYKDPSITHEVYSIHNVEFDRQELRKLVRSEHQAIQQDVGTVAKDSNNNCDNKSMATRANKPLMRFLHSLAKKSLAAE